MSLLDAQRLSIPKAARRAEVHVSTVWRWCLKGVRGRRLRSVCVGGRRFVFTDDLEDFIAAGCEGDSSEPNINIDRASRAEAELAARGI